MTENLEGAPEGMNESPTCSEGDTQLTRPGSRPVRGNVYFIRAGETVKIGFSKSAPHRLAALQTSNAEKLVLMGSFRGTREDEQEAHRKFCHLRIRGEWFTLTEDLEEYIEDRTWKPHRLPPASRETLAAIKKLVIARNAYGAETPIGYRHSNLIEQIRFYEFAEGQQKTYLAGFIARSVREIASLRANVVQ